MNPLAEEHLFIERRIQTKEGDPGVRRVLFELR
jgi:hypothetical protein